MKNNALYFPYINIPNSPSSLRTLLYWDKISAIVPYDYAYYPDLYTPYMQELVFEGLVEQVFPSDYIQQVPNFAEVFLDYVQNHRTRKIVGNTTLIHIEKMGEIGENLQRLGLARIQNYPWYEVDSWTASAFMSYLATVLGGLEIIDAIPVTTEYKDFVVLTDKDTRFSETYNARRVAIRQIILNDIFPYPQQISNLSELARFKQQYGSRMQMFRRKIESITIDLANIENDKARFERTQIVVEQLQDEVRQVSELLKPHFGNIILGTLAPVVASVASLVAIDLSDPALVVGAGVVASSVSLASIAYQIAKSRYDQKDNLNQPLAYAAFANKFARRL